MLAGLRVDMLAARRRTASAGADGRGRESSAHCAPEQRVLSGAQSNHSVSTRAWPGAAMSADLVGLIPAAGRGVRAYPYTRWVPKSMLEVDGVPLVQRNVELLRDQLDVREIVVVVGYRGEVIRDHLGDGRQLGVAIRYVANDRIELNLPYSVYLGARMIQGPCCMILADECYVGSNHRELLAPDLRAAAAVCGSIDSDAAEQVRTNYVAT